MQVDEQLLIILNTVGIAIIGILKAWDTTKGTQTHKIVSQEAKIGHEERLRLENQIIVSGEKVDRLLYEIQELNKLLRKFTIT